MTPMMSSPSRCAADSAFNASTTAPFVNTVPDARASNGRQTPSFASTPSRWYR
ncbi:hypothetical protein NCM_01460 [Burkholderia pseudomallei]